MRFTKVEGCGNHFILVDRTDSTANRDTPTLSHLQSSELSLDSDVIRALCDVNFGIGGDGVLVIRSLSRGNREMFGELDELDTLAERDDFPSHHEARYEMIVYNADGSLAEMCGNGLRCVVKYLYARGLICSEGREDQLYTGAGPLIVSVNTQGDIGVRMGWPRVEAPLTLSDSAERPEVKLASYSLGNPHVVTFNQTHMHDRARLGPAWSSGVPDGINVSFARLITPELIELYVHERGCGWTFACGTGACATVFDAHRRGELTPGAIIEVKLPGGVLSFDIDESGLTMWGPAREVYHGVYLLEA